MNSGEKKNIRNCKPGSGRGNHGKAIIDDPSRPDCWKCGGFMKSDGVKEWHCTPCNLSIRKNPLRGPGNDFFKYWGFDTAAAESYARKCEKPVRLIITSAQNNTEPHPEFFASLKKAADYYKCKIAVIPSHYKNITLMVKDKKSWHPDLEPYLVKSDINFGNVLVKSDVKINATTIWPLSGKQAHGGPHKWVVFGHPQISCEPVASPGNVMPKKLFTTGSCTVANYSVSDMGEKAHFHHAYGALIVERTKEGFCFVRQLNADNDGVFYDLDKRFSPDGVTVGNRVSVLTPGDEHVKFNACKEVTYTRKDSIVKTLKPEYIVRHDVLDGYAGSHHHERDPVLMFKKYHNGDNNYAKELDQCIDFINETTPDNAVTLVVPSNHHDHFFKFLNRADMREDHTNALLIAEMNLKMRLAAMDGANYDPFYLYAKERLTCAYEFLDRNQPHLIGDVDHSQHGDVGANGMKGSAKMLAKTAFKMTVGHSHSARICQGVFQAGSSTERLDYERGLSDHSITHVIQYANHKRTLIDIIDGRWKL